MFNIEPIRWTDFATLSVTTVIIGIIAIVLALKFIKHTVKWIVTGIIILAVILVLTVGQNVTSNVHDYYDYPAVYHAQT